MSRDYAKIAAAQGDAIDSRYHPSAAVRRQLNKVFPTHWSFLLGEIALYSFIVLLITGVWLTLFFDPSMAHVTYDGVYQPPDPPLGGADVRGLDHGASRPQLLHRGVPAPA